jgi:hypothetical protein
MMGRQAAPQHLFYDFSFEAHIPADHLLQKVDAGLDLRFVSMVQQTRVNGLSKVEGEALLTRFPIIETDNLDYQARDMVALAARVLVG